MAKYYRVSKSGKRKLIKTTRKDKEKEKKKLVVKTVVAKQVLPKKAPVVRPVIKLKPKEKEKGLIGRAVDIARGKGEAGEELKKTTTAGTLPIGPGGKVGIIKEAAKGLKIALGGKKAVQSRAVVSFTTHVHKLHRTKAGAEKLIGLGTRTAVRNFVGKPGKTGVGKLFKAKKYLPNREIGNRFVTNTKSIGLTSKFLIGAGLSLGAVSIARDIIGTYPFASFGKEEALQVTNFPISKLIDRGLLDEAEALIDMSDEIINTVPSKIPYKNVLQEFKKYVEAQEKANEGWKEIIDFERNKEPEEDKWAKIYAEQDARKEKQREEDAEYYENIQDNLRRAAEEERTEDTERWAAIHEANEARRKEQEQEELEEMAWKAEYYDLIREGKYEEAQALLESKLKGGD